MENIIKAQKQNIDKNACSKICEFIIDEIRKYNPDIDEWIASHSWCVTTIPDFDGEVNYYVDKQDNAHIVGIGNINFFTTQTSL